MAVYTTILNNRLTTTIPNVVGGAALEAGLQASEVPGVLEAVTAGTISDVGLSSSVLSAITGAIPVAYSQAFKTVYLASLGFGGIAIIGSLLVVDPKKHLTNKVERRLNAQRSKTIATKDSELTDSEV